MDGAVPRDKAKFYDHKGSADEPDRLSHFRSREKGYWPDNTMVQQSSKREVCRMLSRFD